MRVDFQIEIIGILSIGPVKLGKSCILWLAVLRRATEKEAAITLGKTTP